MKLEVYNNRTDNTHENEQFRRVVNRIEQTFKKNNYEGILIGNPCAEVFPRFRADALLLYTNGLLVIDFKDYEGIIELPDNEKDFHDKGWYNESERDRSRRLIKAGTSFKNPFRQLKYYREAFYEIGEKISHLTVNPSRVGIANIFSGPIIIENKVPRSLPYYKICGEAELHCVLEDYASPEDNRYSKHLSTVLQAIFPAEKWESSLPDPAPKTVTSDKIQEILIDENVENHLNNFLTEKGGGVFVLESMDVYERDSWMTYLLSQGTKFDVPQVESWSHSARISNKILKRTDIQTQGVYGVIYGGTHNFNKEDEEIDNVNNEVENLLEIIPVKSNELIDEKGLIVVHEAHLINRSLNQSELLRFGSGRLLEDIIQFLDPESNRKIVFIGDPYSMTYGKNEDSALHVPTLKELYSKKIIHYRSPITKKTSKPKEKLLIDLATSIENKIFNNLNYRFDEDSLINASREKVEENLEKWFGGTLNSEPQNTILFFSRSDCLKTNLWIKRSYLKNGRALAKDDLLIMENNITIPDNTGLQYPKRIVNGMYFSVIEKKESESFTISIKQSNSPIILNFTNLSVKCLSLNSSPVTEIWILNNYFESEDNLSRNEKIAFQVFLNGRLQGLKKENKFIDSDFYHQLLRDSRFLELSYKEKEAVKKLAENYHLQKEAKIKISTTQTARGILSHYNKKYTLALHSKLRKEDPFVNAAFVNYGWAITVHKALSSNFENIIIKGYRKENDGINNEAYFRWLYSGLATGNSSAFIISPQYLNPLMNCTYKDKAKIGPVNRFVNQSPLISFEDYQPGDEFSDKVSKLKNINAIGAICEISGMLSSIGYTLETTENLNPYLNRAVFTTVDNDSKLVLDVDNKGESKNWQVCGIRINKDEGNQELVKEIIEELFQEYSTIPQFQNGKAIFPSDFRDEIYSKWKRDLTESGNELSLIESHNNQDIFRVCQNGDELKFRVWYGVSELNHTKGFINKIEVLEKTSDDISIELKKVLLDDHQ